MASLLKKSMYYVKYTYIENSNLNNTYGKKWK